tara:strand:+ start:1533 stop:1994 length:462 start_codon:yes stop_codon:yes gene_type:complete
MSQDETHGKAKRGDHESFGTTSGKSLLYSDEAQATANKLLGGTHFSMDGEKPDQPSMEEQIKQKLLLAGLKDEQAQAVASGIRECIDGIRQQGGDNTKAVRTVQVFLDGTGVDKKVEQAVCMTCLDALKPQKSAPKNNTTTTPRRDPPSRGMK